MRITSHLSPPELLFIKSIEPTIDPAAPKVHSTNVSVYCPYFFDARSTIEQRIFDHLPKRAGPANENFQLDWWRHLARDSISPVGPASTTSLASSRGTNKYSPAKPRAFWLKATQPINWGRGRRGKLPPLRAPSSAFANRSDRLAPRDIRTAHAGMHS